MDASSEYSPVIQQYLNIKTQVKDSLLFFRLGDFYELFFEDAKIAASVCELTLTARYKHTANPVPMCGVPFHSLAAYIQKLGGRGYTVAICDQVEPSEASKGLVKRQVVRIVTPGLPFDGMELESELACYLSACYATAGIWSVACVEATLGEFWYANFESELALVHFLAPFNVKECLLPFRSGSGFQKVSDELKSCKIQWLDDTFFDPVEAETRLKKHFGVLDLSAWFPPSHLAGKVVCGAALKYIQVCEPRNPLQHLKSIRCVETRSVLAMSPSVIQALELVESPHAHNSRQGLAQVIDRTRTPMGRRLLTQRLVSPLTDLALIHRRLDKQRVFVEKETEITEALSHLKGIGDLSRLVGKLGLGYASPREVWRLKTGLQRAMECVRRLESIPQVQDFLPQIAQVSEIVRRMGEVLVDDPPILLSAGGYIRESVDPELKEAIHAAEQFDAWKAQYEAGLRDQLQIPSLKIKFNRVYGYAIDVTKPHLHKVPTQFVRKQTVASGERFVTQTLIEKQKHMAEACSRRLELEQKIFGGLVAEIQAQTGTLTRWIEALAELDVCAGIAHMAVEQNWSFPTVHSGRDLIIQDGFHPVVWEYLRKQGEHFVPNSVHMLGDQAPLWLISGPNMGGKSTLMKQIAVCVVMAQAGMYVPCSEARIGVVDQIFTRVGSSDALSEGKSTFFVEMQDTARFLSAATAQSLILIDELGRGTSTYDGLSLLWAVCEFLLKRVGCRCFCATHFHELATLKRKYPQVELWHLGASEQQGTLVFDHRLKKGFSDRSYGIQVATLAGVHPEVTQSALRVMKQFQRQPSSQQVEVPL
jgi:DNA mismatch repair protein MutS